MRLSAPLSELVDDLQSGFACGESTDDGIVQLRMNNVDTEGTINFAAIRRVPAEATKDMRRFELVDGDVMFNNTNSPDLVGKSAAFRGFAEPVVFSNHFTRIRVRRDRLEPRFLARWLAAEWRKGRFARMCNQWVNQASVRKDALLTLIVPTPSLAEQRRIADVLDKADAIRRKRKEAIALTEELLRSALLEMFGDPVTNPKGWPVKPLGELLAQPLRNGLSPASGGKFDAQVLTLSAITRGQFDATASKPGAFAAEPWDDVRVDSRDFLICRGNGNVSLVGTAAFPLESMPNMVFPDTMIAARVDQGQVRPAFLNTIWKSPFIRRQIEAGARTTNGTFKINQTVVESVQVVLPPPPKQQVFADLEARVTKNAGHQHAAIDDAEDLFNSLVARAFSGALEASR